MSDALATEVVDLNYVVAANLRAEMGRERWTGRKLAARLGLTPTYVNRRTSGITPMTPADMIIFSDAIGIPVARLFEGTKKAPTGGAVRASLPDLDSNQEPAG